MDRHKAGRRFTFIAAVMFTVSVIFCSSVTFGATSDWTSVLKQYPDSECVFEDINADNNLELLIFSNSTLIVYTPVQNTYQLAGSVPCEYDYNIYFLSSHNGFAIEKYGGNHIYYIYVLSDGKLVQDDTIKEDSMSTENSVTDELGLYDLCFQKYFVCNTTDWYSAYKSVIDQYINIEFETNQSDDYLMNTYKYVNGYYFMDIGNNEYISYALKDLDNNNIPELIIARDVEDYEDSPLKNDNLFSIYTFKEGLLIALEGRADTYFNSFVLNNNEILCYGENINVSIFRFGKLNDGILENAGNYHFLYDVEHNDDPTHSDKNGAPVDPGERLILKKRAEEEIAQLDWKPYNNFEKENPANKVTVLLNGNKLSFDQAPFIENGTTFVPMRAIFEAMGAAVDWNSATQTVTAKKDGTNISLTINNKTAKVNGNNISLNVAPKLVNGSTMVPLRFVSESLGAEVNWDDESRTVSINNK